MYKLDTTNSKASSVPYGWRLARCRPTQYAVWMVKGARRSPGPVFNRLDDALSYRLAHGNRRCDVLLPDNTWYSQLVRAQKRMRARQKLAVTQKNAA